MVRGETLLIFPITLRQPILRMLCRIKEPKATNCFLFMHADGLRQPEYKILIETGEKKIQAEILSGILTEV